MNSLLKQSTAATRTFGPVLDSTGAAYDSMAIGDFSISKNGTMAAMSTDTVTSKGNGMYTIALSTGDTDTTGDLVISCNKSTYVMPMRAFSVLPAATYDAMVTNAAGVASGLPLLASVDSVLTVPAALKVINATSVAGTGTQVAEGFKKVFDVATPVFTAASVNQTGDSYPVVTNISVTGSPSYAAAASYTSTQGTETNTYANTDTSNASYHQIASSASGIDGYYQYNLSADELATSIVFKGRITNNTKSCVVQAYNWVSPGWVTLFTLAGTAGTTDTNQSPALVSKYTGTGANLGIVRIRVYTADTSATLYVDQLIVGKTINNRSVGYSQGAIWVKSDGNAGTATYVNGTADNPCPWANALTISNSLGIKRFQIEPNTTVVLAADQKYSVISGSGYFLNTSTNTRDISYTAIEGCELLEGTFTCSEHEAFIRNCQTGTLSIGEADFHACHITGNITLTQASVPYLFHRCVGVYVTSSYPTIDFGSGVGEQWVNLSQCSGGFKIANMKANDVLTVDGNADIEILSSCTAGTVNINGAIRLTNGGSGQTVNQAGRWGTDQTLATVTTLTNLPAITTDWISAAGISAAAVTKIQTGLATPTNITSATGVQLAASQHVIVDSGTVTTLTNLPAITTDWISAAGVSAAAVTKIQSGLALEATAGKSRIAFGGVPLDLTSRGYTVPATCFVYDNGIDSLGASSSQSVVSYVLGGHMERVRCTGAIKSFKIKLFEKTNLTALKFVVVRQLNTTNDNPHSPVCVSQAVDIATLSTGWNTVDVSTQGMTAVRGDKIGVVWSCSGSSHPFCRSSALPVVNGHQTDADDFVLLTNYGVDCSTGATTLSVSAGAGSVNLQVQMESPVAVVFGDSIASGYCDGNHVTSFVETADLNRNSCDPTQTIAYHIEQMDSRVTTMTHSLSGSGTSVWVPGVYLDASISDGVAGNLQGGVGVTAYYPRIAIMHLGINEAVDPPDTFIANVKSIWQKLLSVGIIPVTYTLPPYRGGTAEQKLAVRNFNSALMDEAVRWGVPVLNSWAVLGSTTDSDDRAAIFGTNNDVHPNDVGHTAMASLLFQSACNSLAVQSSVDEVTGYVDCLPASFPTNFGSLSITSGGAVTAGTVSDKTAYKLASDGLDSIATTAPTGVASNFREMLVQVWRRFFKKATKTTTQIKTYADDGNTVVTTQTVTDDGAGNETLGASS